MNRKVRNISYVKQTLVFLLLCLGYAAPSLAQNYAWAKSMGNTQGDEGFAIAVDASGNVYTTGYFFGTVDFDPGPGTVNLTSAGVWRNIFISKLDASGNFVWAKRMGGSDDCRGYAIAVDASGNVYTTGSFFGTADFDPGAGTVNLTSAGGNDIFISKLDASGNFVWAKSMGGTLNDIGLGIKIDASGNVYTTGSFRFNVDFDPGTGTETLSSAGDEDIFISKLDASGNFVWAKRMGGIFIDIGNGIALDASGNVYTVGSFNSTADFDPGAGTVNLISAGSSDVFISKLDASGNFVWVKSMGGTAADTGYGIALDPSGNVYTTGYFRGTADFDPGAGTVNLTSAGGDDIFISKLDASGNFVWAKSMGANATDTGYGIATDASGNVYTTGVFMNTVDFDPGPGTAELTSLMSSRSIFISKLDASGNFVWAKDMVHDMWDDYGYGIVTDASGNVYTTGSFTSIVDFDPGPGTVNLTSAGQQDIFILKLGGAPNDCAGVPGGTASIDACGVCSGGTTGITPNNCNDCNGTPNGTASVDACGVCSGGTTGITPNACNDCNSTPNGTASIDACGVCSGGTTGITPNNCNDCNGTPNGTAFIDNCGTCVGGTTGLTACAPDCNGVFGGTAFIDNCGTCVGGNTGLTACAPDCNGVFGGTAFIDNCGTCVEGNTGLTACVPDCNGVFGGTASVDNCGRCTGGNTGIAPNTPLTNTTTIACGSYYWAVTGLTYTQSGIYTVTVSDCLIEVLDFTVPPGLAVSLNGTTSACIGSTIGLIATGGNQYQWSGPNGYTNTGSSITRTNASLSMSGTYTVTITNNFCSSVLSINVTVHPAPTANITGGATAVCSGGTISLSAPAGAVGYAWSGPGGFTASGATMNRPNATSAMAGTYTVTVTGAGGCTATATRSISVSAPTNATITGATTFCANGAITLTATTAGISYQWAGPGGFTFAGATMTRTPAVAGTYTVTVTNAAGCISTASRAVTLTAAPYVNINNLTNCARIYFIASGANSYAWSGPNGFVITGHAVVRNPATATMWGTYTVTATGTGGCTATASVTVSPCGAGKNAAEEFTTNMSVYPNPTQSAATISFTLPNEEAVTLLVYDAAGREIAVLFNQTAQPDTAYQVVFDAAQLPNGAYYAVLRLADGTQETQPILVTK